MPVRRRVAPAKTAAKTASRAVRFGPLSVTVTSGNVTDIGNNIMLRKELTKTIAYFRTSSLTNVGADKDTLKRQREAVAAFAKSAGYEIVAEYADDGVKGSDPIDARPGFAEMLARIAGNGVES